MACDTQTATVYSPEQVTEITQRYYTKGLLFRRGKLARQMAEIRQQCPIAQAMDDGHKQRERQLMVHGALGGLIWMGLACFWMNRRQTLTDFLEALA